MPRTHQGTVKLSTVGGNNDGNVGKGHPLGAMIGTQLPCSGR